MNTRNVNLSYSIKEVSAALLRGAPFRWDEDQGFWTEICVPKFPVLFSMVSGFFLYLPGLLKATPKNMPFNISQFAFGLLMVTGLGFCICIFLIWTS